MRGSQIYLMGALTLFVFSAASFAEEENYSDLTEYELSEKIEAKIKKQRKDQLIKAKLEKEKIHRITDLTEEQSQKLDLIALAVTEREMMQWSDMLFLNITNRFNQINDLSQSIRALEKTTFSTGNRNASDLEKLWNTQLREVLTEEQHKKVQEEEKNIAAYKASTLCDFFIWDTSEKCELLPNDQEKLKQIYQPIFQRYWPGIDKVLYKSRRRFSMYSLSSYIGSLTHAVEQDEINKILSPEQIEKWEEFKGGRSKSYWNTIVREVKNQ